MACRLLQKSGFAACTSPASLLAWLPLPCPSARTAQQHMTVKGLHLGLDDPPASLEAPLLSSCPSAHTAQQHMTVSSLHLGLKASAEEPGCPFSCITLDTAPVVLSFCTYCTATHDREGFAPWLEGFCRRAGLLHAPLLHHPRHRSGCLVLLHLLHSITQIEESTPWLEGTLARRADCLLSA